MKHRILGGLTVGLLSFLLNPVSAAPAGKIGTRIVVPEYQRVRLRPGNLKGDGVPALIAEEANRKFNTNARALPRPSFMDSVITEGRELTLFMRPDLDEELHADILRALHDRENVFEGLKRVGYWAIRSRTDRPPQIEFWGQGQVFTELNDGESISFVLAPWSPTDVIESITPESVGFFRGKPIRVGLDDLKLNRLRVERDRAAAAQAAALEPEPLERPNALPRYNRLVLKVGGHEGLGRPMLQSRMIVQDIETGKTVIEYSHRDADDLYWTLELYLRKDAPAHDELAIREAVHLQNLGVLNKHGVWAVRKVNGSASQLEFWTWGQQFVSLRPNEILTFVSGPSPAAQPLASIFSGNAGSLKNMRVLDILHRLAKSGKNKRGSPFCAEHLVAVGVFGLTGRHYDPITP